MKASTCSFRLKLVLGFIMLTSIMMFGSCETQVTVTRSLATSTKKPSSSPSLSSIKNLHDKSSSPRPTYRKRNTLRPTTSRKQNGGNKLPGASITTNHPTNRPTPYIIIVDGPEMLRTVKPTSSPSSIVGKGKIVPSTPKPSPYTFIVDGPAVLKTVKPTTAAPTSSKTILRSNNGSSTPQKVTPTSPKPSPYIFVVEGPELLRTNRPSKKISPTPSPTKVVMSGQIRSSSPSIPSLIVDGPDFIFTLPPSSIPVR